MHAAHYDASTLLTDADADGLGEIDGIPGSVA